MKKQFITLLVIGAFVLMGNYHGMAQGYAASIGGTGGYAEDGFGGNISYNYHLDRWSFLQFGIFGSVANENLEGLSIPYNVFTFQPGYFKRVLLIDTTRPIGFYLGGGPIAGYERINNGNSELPTGAFLDTESKFIYGAYLGLEIEVPFTDNFSGAFKASESYHANSDIGNLYPFVAIGIRVYLY